MLLGWCRNDPFAVLLLGSMIACGYLGKQKGQAGSWAYPLIGGIVVTSFVACILKVANPQTVFNPFQYFALHPGSLGNAACRDSMLIGEALGAIIVLVRKEKTGPRNDHEYIHDNLKMASNAQKGTSHYASAAELMVFSEFGPPTVPREGASARERIFCGGTILGKMNNQPVRVIANKTSLPMTEHVAVCAETGKGKTMSYVIPNIISAACAGESLVITDPKGELTLLLSGWLRSMGYDVYVFNLQNPELGNCWNMVAECQDEEEISAAVEALVVNGPAVADKSGGYWLSKETQLLESLIYLLKADFPPEMQHLPAALSLAVWPEAVLTERFMRAYKERRLPKVGIDTWQGTRVANIENAISGLTAKLKVLRSGKVANLISRQEINMTDIGRKKAALFCIIPANGVSHLRPVISTFYYFFFRRLYSLAESNGGRLPNPTRFLLDEFANIGQIPGFPEIISTARSFGIKVQLVLQTLSQLNNVYGRENAPTILSSCTSNIFLGGKDKETCRYFSDGCGVAAVLAEQEKRDISLPLSRQWRRTEKTQTTASRMLMEPYELSQMPIEDEIVLFSSSPPARLKKLHWTELPQAAEIVDVNENIRREAGVDDLKLEHIIPRNDARAVIPDYDGDSGQQDYLPKSRPPRKRDGGDVSIVRKVKSLPDLDIDDDVAKSWGLK
jgi:type IV secretion system protein VirD4